MEKKKKKKTEFIKSIRHIIPRYKAFIFDVDGVI